MATGHGTKAIIAAFFANLGIAIAKLVGWVFTGASSMLAEAIHSVADAGNQLLLILGLRQTRKAPTDDHPLGFGKSIYFWSFLGVMLVLWCLRGWFRSRYYRASEKLRDFVLRAYRKQKSGNKSTPGEPTVG